jgi:hypothetical protein
MMKPFSVPSQQGKIHYWADELMNGGEMGTWLNYVIRPGEPVSAPRIHCKWCHYTGKVRSDKAPAQCSNENGWVDENGIEHQKCNHPRIWYKWPQGFDPNTCSCSECLIVLEIEQRYIKQFGKLPEPSAMKKRGRPRKYAKIS